MDNVSICVTFIAAIFGIAYPILLEVVSRLDDKYVSQVIIGLFDKEWERKWFNRFLVTSLLSTLLVMLKMPPDLIFTDERVLRWLDGSAEMLMVVSAFLLASSLYFFINKVMIYYTPNRFTPYLIKCDTQIKNDNSDYFYAIADVLFYAIRTQNEILAQTISSHFYNVFNQQRDIQRDKEAVFPRAHYDVIYKTAEEMAIVKNRRLQFIGDRAAGSIWLLGDSSNCKISRETYNWMWHTILLSLSYEREDFVMVHWKTAYNYYRNSLNNIPFQYNEDTDTIINQNEINSRKEERKQFLEFHYALGGMLLYKKKYDLLYKAFNYTLSHPPDYVLLPQTMNDVFLLFFDFIDPYHFRRPFIEHTYPFPEFDGLNAGDFIRTFICKYIALLFIRQYTIVPYLIIQRPLDMPNFPSTQREKRNWLDSIDYFQAMVEEIMSTPDLLEAVHFNTISEEKCAEEKVLPPLIYIPEVKRQLEEDMKLTLVIQPVSPTKKANLIQTTIGGVKALYEQYSVIDAKDLPKVKTKKYYIRGLSMVVDKSTFADNQEAEHLNYEGYLLRPFLDKYKQAMSEIFVRISTHRHLLKKEEIMPALRNLKIDYNYVIICFGIDISNMISQSKDESLKSIRCHYFPEANFALTGQFLVVMHKKHLPTFVYRTIEKSQPKENELNTLLPEYNTYLTMVDLNQDEELRKSLENTYPNIDLKKSVYTGIFVDLELNFLEEGTYIEIQLYSPFEKHGIPTRLSDVRPFS